jgi:hypothetical protein
LVRAPGALATSGLEGAFIGDYTGLASAGTKFAALYALPSRDPADVFLASVTG